MIFESRLYKFGKGKNISAIMNEENKITIYYQNKGILKKEIQIENQSLIMNQVKESYPYTEVIPVDDSHLITRLGKSIGILINE